jgi:hypothetical protein
MGLREVGHGISPRLEEQEDVLAVGDPPPAEAHAPAPAQALDVEQPLGERIGHQEPADGSW